MKIIKSKWSNNIYPCLNSQCDFIGLLDAFTYESCYNPCPRCGSIREKRTGRFVYKKYWFRKIFVGVEWL